jgi:folate-binding protein YgfZ
MNSTWVKLLENQSSSGDINNLKTISATPLDSMSVLSVSGDDAQSFLQNLVTNDVSALEFNQGQLAGLCNPKGRLFAVFIIIKTEFGFKLILPKTTLPILKQRLSMFILRSKVEITDQTESFYCIGLMHDDPIELSSLSLPNKDFSGSYKNGIQALKMPSKENYRYILILEENQLDTVNRIIADNQWELISEKQWHFVNIISGIPFIYPETKELFTPQQINLDLIDAVSFKKGCYSGQEVVARLHYLGKPSRRMFLLQLNENISAHPSNEILDNENNICGQVIQAIPKSEKTYLLASMKLSDVGKQLFLDNRLIDNIVQL